MDNSQNRVHAHSTALTGGPDARTMDYGQNHTLAELVIEAQDMKEIAPVSH